MNAAFGMDTVVKESTVKVSNVLLMKTAAAFKDTNIISTHPHPTRPSPGMPYSTSHKRAGIVDFLQKVKEDDF